MATKAKELTTEQATQAAAALPVESAPVQTVLSSGAIVTEYPDRPGDWKMEIERPLVYLEGQCTICKAFPIKRQGGRPLEVTCGRCGKIIES